MYYGVEQTTDTRYRQTVIRKFNTDSALRRWLDQPLGTFAWPGAASEQLPPSRQNWRRRIRVGYEMPRGWRLFERDAKG